MGLCFTCWWRCDRDKNYKLATLGGHDPHQNCSAPHAHFNPVVSPNNRGTGDIFLVYAKTGDKGSARDVSLFVLEKGAPGFNVGQKINNKCGMRASATAELHFDNVVRGLALDCLRMIAMTVGLFCWLSTSLPAAYLSACSPSCASYSLPAPALPHYTRRSRRRTWWGRRATRRSA